MDENTIADQLDILEETKSQMRTVLLNKGQDIDTNFREYVDAIDNLTNTSDATATEEDIVLGKTAYVNGELIEGIIDSMDQWSDDCDGVITNYDIVTDVTQINLNKTKSDGKGALLYDEGNTIGLKATGSQIATALNISASDIKTGVRILDVIGTYSGEGMKEYASETDMNNDIANIQEGEVVKVVDNRRETYSYLYTQEFYSITNGYKNYIIVNIAGDISIFITNGSFYLGTDPNYSGLVIKSTDTAENYRIRNVDEWYYIQSKEADVFLTTYTDGITPIYDVTQDIYNGNTLVIHKLEPLIIFIKETTMKKLVKEEETISPQEYNEVNDVADNILGE